MDVKILGEGLFSLQTSIKSIKTPFFFPAISSVKTTEDVEDYYYTIRESSYPGFLISAYDLAHHKNADKIINDLNKATDLGTMTIVDSGGYESYWHKDEGWSEKQYEEVLKKVKVDVSFSYDLYWNKYSKLHDQIKNISHNAAIAASIQTHGDIAPIIHGTPENLPSLITGLLKELTPLIIGVTEEELGKDLIERCRTVKKIRDEISKNRPDLIIHVLGAGNPASILCYSLLGANSFDGLSWCRSAIDPSNGQEHDFSQMGLFKCNCKACLEEKSYTNKTLLHNLIFYNNFCKEINESVAEGKIQALLNKYLPKGASEELKKLVGLHE